MKTIKQVRDILRKRSDSEHEMTLNRSAFATITLLYLGLTAPYFEKSEQLLNTTLWTFCLYYAVSAGIFLHIIKRPCKSVGRRLFAMVHDFTMISWIAIAAGETAGLLYPLYLWTILGNGFRFGARYIYTAGGIALVSFGVVLWVTGFGQLHPELAVGLWLGLLVLPLYVSRLLRQLSEATRQAEQASRAKSAFLASVSHELRTPLNAIIGLSDLLRGQELTREQVGSVALIGSAGRSLLGLINSLLEFSRLEAGRMPVNLVEFDLFEMAAQIRALLAPQARDKGLHLALQIATGTPRLIEADRKHIEEIIFNLVGNAIKFTTTGHVLIRLGSAVPLSGDAGARLVLTVTDTGAGIAPEAQSRIFERFSQADETIVDRFGGTGLGLAICKQLVELQGGTIGVTSVPGEGSTFTVELDVREGAGQAPAPASDRVLTLTDDRRFVARLAGMAPVVEEYADLPSLLDAATSQGHAHAIAFIDCRRNASAGQDDEVIKLTGSQTVDTLALIRLCDGDTELANLPVHYVTQVSRKASAGDLAAAIAIAEAYLGLGRSASERFTLKPASRPLAVLVAEDNPTNQIVARAILEGAGHSVVVVDDGDKALDALTDAEFDIVLMDVNMPGLNGLEATRLYRFGVPGESATPIVGLTADATPEMQAKCLAAGMAACASKPIEAARLLELIEEVMARTHPADASSSKIALPEPPAPLFNTARVQELARIGGVSFPRKLIGEFVPQAGEVIDAMRADMQRRDLKGLRSRAHFLKSSAGAVGADRIASRCAVLQSIGPAQFAPLKESTIDDIAEDLRAFRQDADCWFGNTPAP